MKQKFFAGLGVLALVVFGGGGLWGWLQVKEKLQVTIQQAGDGADPLREQLLLQGEELRTLRQDLDALAGALEQNFQSLYQGLEQQAEARDQVLRPALEAGRVEQGRLREKLDQLGQTLVTQEHLQARLAGVQLALEQLSQAASASALLAQAEVPPIQPETAWDVVQEVPLESALAAQVPAAEPLPTVPPDEPARNESTSAPLDPPNEAGFLSFRLPSKGFAFAEAQEWQLLEDLSRVGFDAKTTLHDFSAATTAVRGNFQTTLADPSQGTRGKILVQAEKLDSGDGKRDSEMRSRLDVKAFPEFEYVIESFAATSIDEGSGKLAGRVNGRMTLHGKSKAFAMDVRASLDASKRLLIEGDAALLLSDFGVEAPNKLGLIVMEDEVRVWIALRARSTGKAREEGADIREEQDRAD